MVSIDTILPQNGPVRIGNRSFFGATTTPFRVRMQMFVGIMGARIEKRRSNLRLAELSDDQLRDIGLTRSQARTRLPNPAWWYLV